MSAPAPDWYGEQARGPCGYCGEDPCQCAAVDRAIDRALEQAFYGPWDGEAL